MLISSVSYSFCISFGLGVLFALGLVRRLDLEAKFFRTNGAIAAVLILGAAYFGGFFHSHPYRTEFFIVLALTLIYSIGVFWFPVAVERFLLWFAFLWGMSLLFRTSPHGLHAISALLGGAIMGTALVAMNVGHSYLSSVKLSIRPLKTTAGILGALVVFRALWLLILVPVAIASSPGAQAQAERFLQIQEVTLISIGLVRILFGVLGPLLLAYLTWRTVKIQSTQSATGILYALVVLVIMGEICATFIRATTYLPV